MCTFCVEWLHNYFKIALDLVGLLQLGFCHRNVLVLCTIKDVCVCVLMCVYACVCVCVCARVCKCLFVLDVRSL